MLGVFISFGQKPISFGYPSAISGVAVNDLIAHSPPLDTNSVYCNLLQCTHFADTCICAEDDGELVGFISGYLIPTRTDTLFIWQVAIDVSMRNQGLATTMLQELLKRPVCQEVSFLETTITPSNHVSWGLFNSLARRLEAQTNVIVAYDKDAHFCGRHETEQLLRIGPFSMSK